MLDVTQLLATFSEPQDPWTTEESHSESKEMLRESTFEPLDETERNSLLARLLREKVKPSFAKSKNADVTKAGRKAIAPLPLPMEHSIDERELKAWKYRDVHIVTVFDWVLKQLDVELRPEHLSHDAADQISRAKV